MVAWCEAANKHWRRAATLLGAAYAVWKHSGANTSYDSMHRFAHDAVEEEVRTRLGREAFDKAYSEGTECSSEQAVALAMQHCAVSPAAADKVPDQTPRNELTGARTRSPPWWPKA